MPHITLVLLSYDPLRSQCLQEHRSTGTTPAQKSDTHELSPNTEEARRAALLLSLLWFHERYVPLVPLVSTLTFYNNSLRAGFPLSWWERGWQLEVCPAHSTVHAQWNQPEGPAHFGDDNLHMVTSLITGIQYFYVFHSLFFTPFFPSGPHKNPRLWRPVTAAEAEGTSLKVQEAARGVGWDI